MSAVRPWRAFTLNRWHGDHGTLLEARRACDARSSYPIRAAVKHTLTGERWTRLRAGWALTRRGTPRAAPRDFSEPQAQD